VTHTSTRQCRSFKLRMSASKLSLALSLSCLSLSQRLKVRIYIRIIAVCSSALLGQWPYGATAQTAWESPEFLQATEAFRRGDCQTAWDIVWPLAKAGSAEARYFLYGTIISRMIPPGDSGVPRSVFVRHNLVLAAYAALAVPRPGQGDPNHRWARNEIPNSIKALALGVKGDRVAQCYKSDASFQECLALAVSLGIIPTFEDYAAQVERQAGETGLSARCSPRPW